MLTLYIHFILDWVYSGLKGWVGYSLSNRFASVVQVLMLSSCFVKVRNIRYSNIYTRPERNRGGGAALSLGLLKHSEF